jgi:hypothetical protein
MTQLSSTSLSRVEAEARRAARRLAGAAAPITIGIDVSLGAGGSIRGVSVGDGGPLYELDRLDPETIAGAMFDAARVARSGPRAWRRIG